MTETLFTWMINLIQAFADFGTWLINPLPYIQIAPLYFFSLTGLTTIVVIHLVRLFIGG